MSDRAEILEALLQEGEVEEAVLFQIGALLDDGSKQYEPVLHACMLALASSQYRGSLHRVWAQQSLLNRYEDWGVRVPHPKTTCEHLPNFQSPEYQEHRIYGMNPTELWCVINALLRDQLLAIVKVLGFKANEWIITVDTNTRPNYSKLGNKARKGIIVPQGLTPSAKFAVPAFREHNNSTVPLHDGTGLGDEYIVCFAHHVRTGATFPVGVLDCLRLEFDSAEAITTLLAQLEGLPPPLAVLLDREFYAGEVWRALNTACKGLGTMWMMPVRRSGREAAPGARKGKLSLPATVKQCYSKAQPVPGEPETLYYAEKRGWPDDPSVQFTLVVYFRKKKRDYEPSLLDWDEAQVPPGRYTTAFITNFDVPPALVQWLASQYGRRWACETAFSALEHNFGYSPSKTLNLKFLVYGLNLVQYGLYGAWRYRASRDLRLPMDHPWLGLAPYLELLQRRLDVARFQ